MIEVNGLSKNFHELKAVDEVGFKAGQGEVLGILGPNGAGKSTTMKMITGFLEPSSGTADICGHSILKEKLAAQGKIGYVPENAPLYEEMHVREFLHFIAQIREINSEEISSKIDTMIQTCALTQVEYQKIETLSKGYKRRVSLAQSLIHDPPVLILDEPTDGLDPNQKHDVRNLISRLAAKKCILISTHILEEVEAVCTRCIIIGQGKKLFEGTPEELKSKSSKGRIDDVFRAITTAQSVEGVSL